MEIHLRAQRSTERLSWSSFLNRMCPGGRQTTLGQSGGEGQMGCLRAGSTRPALMYRRRDQGIEEQ